MGSFSDFYNKKNKKRSKEELAKKAARQPAQGGGGYAFTQPVVLGHGKKKTGF